MPEPGCNCGTPTIVQTSGVRTTGVSGGTVFAGKYRGNGVFEETVPAPSAAKSNNNFMSRLQSRFSGVFGTRSTTKAAKDNTIIEEVLEDGTIVEVSEPIMEGTAVNRMPNAPAIAPAKASFNEPPLSSGGNTANVIITNKTGGSSDSTVVPVQFRPAQTAPAQTAPAQVTPGTSAAPAKASALLPKFVNKVGHEDDFSWITGQLGQVGGRWTIHYATPETVDRYHGTLVLAGSVDMSSYQVGDLVSVHGGVIQTTTHGPAYLIQNINLIEHK